MRWQQRRERSQITSAYMEHADNARVFCVYECVAVESQVRLIPIHTLANGDKVSSLVRAMSLAHLNANGDIPRSSELLKHQICSPDEPQTRG